MTFKYLKVLDYIVKKIIETLDNLERNRKLVEVSQHNPYIKKLKKSR